MWQRGINDSGRVAFFHSEIDWDTFTILRSRILTGNERGLEVAADSTNPLRECFNAKILQNGTVYFEQFQLDSGLVDLFGWNRKEISHRAQHEYDFSGAPNLLDVNGQGKIVFQSDSAYPTGIQVLERGTVSLLLDPVAFGGALPSVANLALNDQGSYAFIP